MTIFSRVGGVCGTEQLPVRHLFLVIFAPNSRNTFKRSLTGLCSTKN